MTAEQARAFHEYTMERVAKHYTVEYTICGDKNHLDWVTKTETREYESFRELTNALKRRGFCIPKKNLDKAGQVICCDHHINCGEALITITEAAR